MGNRLGGIACFAAVSVSGACCVLVGVFAGMDRVIELCMRPGLSAGLCGLIDWSRGSGMVGLGFVDGGISNSSMRALLGGRLGSAPIVQFRLPSPESMALGAFDRLVHFALVKRHLASRS